MVKSLTQDPGVVGCVSLSYVGLKLANTVEAYGVLFDYIKLQQETFSFFLCFLKKIMCDFPCDSTAMIHIKRQALLSPES